LRSTLRSLVTFRYHNLIGSWRERVTYDVIFLRNVLIYFDVELKREILNQLKHHLNPGGILLLGSAETTANLDPDWQIRREGPCVYYSLD
jgi:chemotaxis protein methyltransferase CheR